LGIAFDSGANEKNASCITKPQSRVAVYVIATNEELEIAKQSYDLLQSKGL
jgi:acetate kinase